MVFPKVCFCYIRANGGKKWAKSFGKLTLTILSFFIKMYYFLFKNDHFWPKSAILTQKKTPAAARRYNNKGFKQEKRLQQHAGTTTKVLSKKNAYGSTQVQKQRF